MRPNQRAEDGHGERIGPNAIIQLCAALQGEIGPERAAELVRAAGLGTYLERPPQRMVDEHEVIALHARVRAQLSAAAARTVAREAGARTADYLLANRIPAIVQHLLRWLPATLASRALLAAITRHAWTFAGSGQFAARSGRPVEITIAHCPICRDGRADGPICDYYAATFERLYARLVHGRSRVAEIECAASGAPRCRFLIDWR
jgi:divinyl protochlorophyllide a 8-vinyl-reductase